MNVLFLDDDNDGNVRYIVVTDITPFSYLVYRPPMMSSADKNISVNSADQYHPKLHILYPNTRKLNKQSAYTSWHIYGLCGYKQNLIKSVVSHCLFLVDYST